MVIDESKSVALDKSYVNDDSYIIIKDSDLHESHGHLHERHTKQHILLVSSK